MQKMQDVKIDDAVVGKMFEVGAHYGYRKSRRHPSVANYIYTTKNKNDIINLEKTKEMLGKALIFVQKLAETEKILLFIGTKPEGRDLVENAASSVDMPYVTERWIGGTISNWSEIKKNLVELENYRKEEREGEMAKYTKKEKLLMAKKVEKLERFYNGIAGLKKKPDAIFVIDAKNDKIAVEEATQIGIPVVALVNSDSDIRDINYPVVANDAARSSIEYFAQAISEAYRKGGENKAKIK